MYFKLYRDIGYKFELYLIKDLQFYIGISHIDLKQIELIKDSKFFDRNFAYIFEPQAEQDLKL